MKILFWKFWFVCQIRQFYPFKIESTTQSSVKGRFLNTTWFDRMYSGQMISWSTSHKQCFSSAVGGLWVWFTKNAHWPCKLTPVTLLPLCVSPPQPDHSTPVTAVLALPTGYNYSVFCCSPFSLSLSHLSSVSLSPAGSWHQRPGGGPQGPCFVFTTCWTLLTAPLLWTGRGAVMGKGKGKGRRGCYWMPRPLG